MGAAANAGEVKVGGDGLYHQDWFLQSFLDLKEDLQEAADSGKRMVVLWEQKGCPYCKELHQVNFADPAIRKYIQENFIVLQMDIWGARPVTDFDGQELSEKQLARRYGVRSRRRSSSCRPRWPQPRARPARLSKSRACPAISSRRPS